MTPFSKHEPSPYQPLLLGRRGLLSLSLRTLLANTDESSLAPGVSKLPVGLLFAWVVRNLALGDDGLVLDGDTLVGVLDLSFVTTLPDLLDLLSTSVALLGRLGLAWEKDQASLVCLETLDVGGEGLFGEVLSAGIDRDTDGGRQLAWDASGLLCVNTA